MQLLLTPEALADDLRRLGMSPGDTLMIHVSLRAVGPLEGGPDTLLNALESAVGPDGTLLMILGAEIEHDFVNRLPQAERADLLTDAPPFDPATAPVFHEVGHFAEIFRRRTGTLVTDNPSGRFGARGARAQQLLEDAPWHDYYGPGSPLDRFCRIGGRVLRLGADLDTTTVLHFAEYLADLPNKRRVRRHYRCHGRNGPETRVVECLDESAHTRARLRPAVARNGVDVGPARAQRIAEMLAAAVAAENQNALSAYVGELGQLEQSFAVERRCRNMHTCNARSDQRFRGTGTGRENR